MATRAHPTTETSRGRPCSRSRRRSRCPVLRAPPEVTKQGPSKLDVLLLSCGIVAPLLYVATDVFLAMRWEGYSYRDQTISELNAIGAPARNALDRPRDCWLCVPRGVRRGRLEISGCQSQIARGCRWADRPRRLRVVRGAVFRPMHVREADETLTDALHVGQLAVAGPLLLVIIGFGAAAFGWRFRLYSAATVLVIARVRRVERDVWSRRCGRS